MIRAEGIAFGFGTRSILDAVDLTPSPGQVLGLIGPNGSGKSTLLRCLHGELSPAQGTVMLDDRTIEDLSVREIARRVGVVPQLSSGTALGVPDFVLLGRIPHRSDFGRFNADDHRIAAEALHRVGALDLLDRRLDQLSGGERQRVAIARCLAQQTATLLLDEPTNHLDIRYQHDILSLVRGLGITTVVVLHDLNLAARFCDEVVLLHDTKVVTHGSPDEVLTPGVLESVYGLPVRRIHVGGQIHLIFGDLPDLNGST
jgi:iron complex transport system ATP-binding protein